MIRCEYPQTVEENFALGQWVMDRMPDATYFNYQCIAFFEPGKGIRGVVLYHNFRQTDIEVVFVGEGKWANRQAIVEALSYPFSIGCQRITALIRKDNMKSRKMVQQIGFKQEGKLRRANADNSDLLIYGLLPNECRLRRYQAEQREAA